MCGEEGAELKEVEEEVEGHKIIILTWEGGRGGAGTCLFITL